MSKTEAASPLVDVQQVSKQFGDRIAVKRVSLCVQAGELVGLAGLNGSGKSTLLRLLSGLLRPDAGSGTVLGCVLGQPDRCARNRLGYLPQRAALYPRISVLENLRFRAAVAGMAQPTAAARAAITSLALEHRATDPLSQLSGGWIRRVEIAATLIHLPQLALLDEPTTGLDNLARAHIWRQLDHYRERGGAVIFSSHDSSELQRATQCLTPGEARGS